MAKPSPAVPGKPTCVLALQGGGALGAFSWGVLDRLLDVPDLRIEVVSGASAGAMNAAMLVQGLATGGPAEAKRLLEALWRRVAVAAGSPDLDLPIEDLDLSERPRNCLKRAQVNTVGELVEKTIDDLLAITNFGQKSLDEVIQKLDERGLSLRTRD